MSEHFIGPILFVDDLKEGHLHLSALVFTKAQEDPSPLGCNDIGIPFVEIASESGWRVLRARFNASHATNITYSALGKQHTIRGALDKDLAIAFASCNGEEHGDMNRDPIERNAMWARLLQDHQKRPFHLLLHGGDQIYADEVTKSHPLTVGWPDEIPDAPTESDLAALRATLRRGFFERYLHFFETCPEMVALGATVPSLSQWDDHDICDGWGSLAHAATTSEVGKVLFDVAFETALIFQHACTPGDLPGRFHDHDNNSLSWWIDLPGTRIVAPDLRSERQRRQVMGPVGWGMMDMLATLPPTDQYLVISSVPLLGPRMSVLESLTLIVPKMRKYEDDLRDQWQSRAHRDEWRRMLTTIAELAARHDADVTVLSGEIHLAAYASMPMDGGRKLHQLISSGVAHRPPPPQWAGFLGWLASFGEDPIKHSPITINRIPGRSQRYIADRNCLTITRNADNWQAVWDFEEAGKTPPLVLSRAAP